MIDELELTADETARIEQAWHYDVEMTDIHRAAKRVDPNHPFVKKMNRMKARPTFLSEGRDADEFLAVRAMFYALPIEEQRRLLQGWEPCPNRPGPKTIAAIALDGCGQRVVRVMMREDGDVAVKPCFVMDDSNAPVIVSILEGTSREEALDALKKAIEKVLKDWQELCQAPDLHDFARGGTDPEE